MRINKIDLLKKGWNIPEIEQASKIISEAETKKHITIQFLDKSVYWALLFIIIISNFITTIFFLPFMFTLENVSMILIVGIMGFVFGTLISTLIKDIEETEHKTYSNLKAALLLNAFINALLIYAFSKDFSNKTGLYLSSNPILVSSIFFIVYLLPYGVHIYMKYREE